MRDSNFWKQVDIARERGVPRKLVIALLEKGMSIKEILAEWAMDSRSDEEHLIGRKENRSYIRMLNYRRSGHYKGEI